MAAWCVIAALAILTIYWMITSLLTLVTVTIPGIYPLRAYFETSVLVSGRRVKILLRILMMLLPLVILWLVVLIPVVLIDQAVTFDSVPFVPTIYHLVGSGIINLDFRFICTCCIAVCWIAPSSQWARRIASLSGLG